MQCAPKKEDLVSNKPNETANTEREEARARLETYLRAVSVRDPERRGKIVQRILERAEGEKAKNSADPGKPDNLTALAMREIHEETEQWFEKLIGSKDQSPARGFIALCAVDAMSRWPDVFLAEEVPADLRQAVLNCEVRAAPDLSFTSMVPEPFVNPLREINLPAPLSELVREMAPQMAKLFTFVLCLAVWQANLFQ